MDYDADGTLDFISGSYDPGDLYLFRGLGQGEYAAVERLLDETGLPVVHHPVELRRFQEQERAGASFDDTVKDRVASFGSWPAMVDWDADGDLDLLIGSFSGQLFRRQNVGTRQQPVWGRESVPVEAGGEPLRVSAHADPVAADWDGDGRWDLVVAAGDGSVGWHRNTGAAGAPQLGPRRLLVPARSEDKFLTQFLSPGEPPTPGVRAQICVVDYDLDGRLDLVVGDYRDDIVSLRELSAEQRAELDALLSSQARLRSVMRETEDEAQQERLQAEHAELERAKQAYVAEGDEQRRESFVWLYLRKQAPARSAAAIDARASTGDGRGPVAVAARLTSKDRQPGVVALTVELDVQQGWHVYGKVPPGSPYPATRVGLRLSDGLEPRGEWARPAGHPAREDPALEELDGRVAFTRELSVAAGTASLAVDVEVSYQVCNADLCLPPATQSLTLAWSAAPTPRELAAALVAEHAASELGYVESYRAFEPRFAALAAEHRGTEGEVTALLWLIGQSWWLREDGKMESTALPIADDLLERHLDSPQLGRMIDAHYVFGREQARAVFERLLESPHRVVQAAAHLGLARLDERAARGSESGGASEHLAVLLADYADVPFKATTYGALAAAYGSVLPPERLAVGAAAPDIRGEDVDGVEFRLSDYRGKVVLLDFWGDW